MTPATAQTIINMIGATGGNGGYSYQDESDKLRSTPTNLCAKRAGSAKQRYIDAILSIGYPATSQEIADVLGVKAASVPDYIRSHMDVFEAELLFENGAQKTYLYWIKGVKYEQGD